MSLLTELRRRNVFRVGAAYAVVAWLLLQITDVVLPTFDSPQWVAQTITFVLAIGFPIAVVLAWALELTPRGVEVDAAARSGMRGATPPTAVRFGYISQALLLVAVGFLVVDQYFLDESSSDQATNVASEAGVTRSSILMGASQQLGNTLLRAHVTFSPNSRRIVYAAQANGLSQLYIRDLDRLEARLIPDTEGAFYPFFSPDGEWVGYFNDSEGQLRKAPLQGGPSQLVTETGYSAGATWSGETIYFGSGTPQLGRNVYRVSAGGGEREQLVEPAPDSGFGWPEQLPGGAAILLGIKPGLGGSGPAREGSVGVLDLTSGEVRALIETAHTPRYSATGHILFARAGALWAAPFDVERRELAGAEVLVVDGVQQDGLRGGAAYAVSPEGTLVYAPGGDMTTEDGTALVWVDRQGVEEPLNAEQRQYLHMTLSPDGQRLAYTRTDGTGNQDVYIYDLVRGSSSRLTFDAAVDDNPVWSPDGTRIVFRSARDGMGLYAKSADGTGQVELLLATGTNLYPSTFTPDGAELLTVVLDSTVGSLYALSMNERHDRRLRMEVAPQNHLTLSPDGRWMAYASQESGVREIYLSRYPDIDAGKWQVSDEGGAEPAWSRDGSEIFFRRGPDMMAVSFESAGEIPVLGTPKPLFSGDFVSVQRPTFALSADGERFLMLKASEQLGQLGAGMAHLIMVENWSAELRRLAPPVQNR